MVTILASRSSHLAQPGMPLDEPEEPVGDPPAVDPIPAVPYHRATTLSPQESQRAREARWVCEWWPPD